MRICSSIITSGLPQAPVALSSVLSPAVKLRGITEMNSLNNVQRLFSCVSYVLLYLVIGDRIPVYLKNASTYYDTCFE